VNLGLPAAGTKPPTVPHGFLGCRCVNSAVSLRCASRRSSSLGSSRRVLGANHLALLGDALREQRIFAHQRGTALQLRRSRVGVCVPIGYGAGLHSISSIQFGGIKLPLSRRVYLETRPSADRNLTAVRSAQLTPPLGSARVGLRERVSRGLEELLARRCSRASPLPAVSDLTPTFLTRDGPGLSRGSFLQDEYLEP